MEAVILEPLAVQVDVPALFQKLHVREGSAHTDEVRGLVAEAEAIARPRVVYKVAFIEARGDDYVVADGARFTSRILRVNLDGLHRFFPFVGTSGREMEAWAQSKQGLLESFYADAVNQAVLHAAMATFSAHLVERFQLSQVATMNPGSLTDWPLREQRTLFGLLGDVEAAIGVTLTDSLLMVPTKSVSGILFVAEETFASCQLCPREACPNRRAPYDASLYERKYTAAGNYRYSDDLLESRL